MALLFFCLISLPNHYHLRTFAFDLGIYNNSVYQYSHLFNNQHPLANGSVTNFLGDHFAFYTILFSPFYYLFGNYTTLLFQIVAIVFGGYGIYKLVKIICPLKYMAELAMLQFYFFFGFQSALSYDYHDNVIAAALLPWFFYFVKIQHIKKTILFAFLILIGKENMALWLVFICIGLLLLKENQNQTLKFSLIFISLFSAIYFWLVVAYFMPSFSNANNFGHFKYDIISQNTTISFESVKNLFLALFVDTTYPENYSAIKIETYLCLAFAGGLSLLINYHYLIMLVPIFIQKMYHNEITKWGICYHYSVEFVAIVVISLFVVISKYIKQPQIKYVTVGLFTLTTLFVTFSKMVERKSLWYDTQNGNIFCKEHYQNRFDRKTFLEGSSFIPPEAKLSALDNFVPQLANRKCIYLFPAINDAEYLYIAATEYSYTVTGGEITTQIDSLKKSNSWETVFEKNGFVVFKKRS